MQSFTQNHIINRAILRIGRFSKFTNLRLMVMRYHVKVHILVDYIQMVIMLCMPEMCRYGTDSSLTQAGIIIFH